LTYPIVLTLIASGTTFFFNCVWLVCVCLTKNTLLQAQLLPQQLSFFVLLGINHCLFFSGMALIAAVVVFVVENQDFRADFHASFYLTLISGADGLLASLLMLILIRVPGEYNTI
jgi:hypothetical protein